MSRGREYQYERIDRALEAQDDWYLQRRKEIQEEDEYVQTKLEISQPGDVHEQEADRIASNVVRGGDATLSNILSTGSSIQPKSEGESTYADSSLQSSLFSTKGSGQSLDDSTRGEMESKMGANLSDVKIHTGGAAHALSERINAKAFTHGQDIYFKNGNYNTHSDSGKELLAHEIVHTQQQKGGLSRKIQRKKEIDADKVDDVAAEVSDILGFGYQRKNKLKFWTKKTYVTDPDHVKATPEESIKAYRYIRDTLNEYEIGDFYQRYPGVVYEMDENLPVEFRESDEFGMFSGVSEDEKIKLLNQLADIESWKDSGLLDLTLRMVVNGFVDRKTMQIDQRVTDVIADKRIFIKAELAKTTNDPHPEGFKESETILGDNGFQDGIYVLNKLNESEWKGYSFGRLVGRFIGMPFRRGALGYSFGERVSSTFSALGWLVGVDSKLAVKGVSLYDLGKSYGGTMGGFNFQTELDEKGRAKKNSKEGKVDLLLDNGQGTLNISAQNLPFASVNYQGADYIFQSGAGYFSGLEMQMNWPVLEKGVRPTGEMILEIPVDTSKMAEMVMKNMLITMPNESYGIGSLTIRGLKFSLTQSIIDSSALNGYRAITTGIYTLLDVISVLQFAVTQALNRFTIPTNDEQANERTDEKGMLEKFLREKGLQTYDLHIEFSSLELDNFVYVDQDYERDENGNILNLGAELKTSVIHKIATGHTVITANSTGVDPAKKDEVSLNKTSLQSATKVLDALKRDIQMLKTRQADLVIALNPKNTPKKGERKRLEREQQTVSADLTRLGTELTVKQKDVDDLNALVSSQQEGMKMNVSLVADDFAISEAGLLDELGGSLVSEYAEGVEGLGDASVKQLKFNTTFDQYATSNMSVGLTGLSIPLLSVDCIYYANEDYSFVLQAQKAVMNDVFASVTIGFKDQPPSKEAPGNDQYSAKKSIDALSVELTKLKSEYESIIDKNSMPAKDKEAEIRTKQDELAGKKKDYDTKYGIVASIYLESLILPCTSLYGLEIDTKSKTGTNKVVFPIDQPVEMDNLKASNLLIAFTPEGPTFGPGQNGNQGKLELVSLTVPEGATITNKDLLGNPQLEIGLQKIVAGDLSIDLLKDDVMNYKLGTLSGGGEITQPGEGGGADRKSKFNLPLGTDNIPVAMGTITKDAITTTAYVPKIELPYVDIAGDKFSLFVPDTGNISVLDGITVEAVFERNKDKQAKNSISAINFNHVVINSVTAYGMTLKKDKITVNVPSTVASVILGLYLKNMRLESEYDAAKDEVVWKKKAMMKGDVEVPMEVGLKKMDFSKGLAFEIQDKLSIALKSATSEVIDFDIFQSGDFDYDINNLDAAGEFWLMNDNKEKTTDLKGKLDTHMLEGSFRKTIEGQGDDARFVYTITGSNIDIPLISAKPLNIVSEQYEFHVGKEALGDTQLSKIQGDFTLILSAPSQKEKDQYAALSNIALHKSKTASTKKERDDYALEAKTKAPWDIKLHVDKLSIDMIQSYGLHFIARTESKVVPEEEVANKINRYNLPNYDEREYVETVYDLKLPSSSKATINKLDLSGFEVHVPREKGKNISFSGNATIGDDVNKAIDIGPNTFSVSTVQNALVYDRLSDKFNTKLESTSNTDISTALKVNKISFGGTTDGEFTITIDNPQVFLPAMKGETYSVNSDFKDYEKDKMGTTTVDLDALKRGTPVVEAEQIKVTRRKVMEEDGITPKLDSTGNMIYQTVTTFVKPKLQDMHIGGAFLGMDENGETKSPEKGALTTMDITIGGQFNGNLLFYKGTSDFIENYGEGTDMDSSFILEAENSTDKLSFTKTEARLLYWNETKEELPTYQIQLDNLNRPDNDYDALSDYSPSGDYSFLDGATGNVTIKMFGEKVTVPVLNVNEPKFRIETYQVKTADGFDTRFKSVPDGRIQGTGFIDLKNVFYQLEKKVLEKRDGIEIEENPSWALTNLTMGIEDSNVVLKVDLGWITSTSMKMILCPDTSKNMLNNNNGQQYVRLSALLDYQINKPETDLPIPDAGNDAGRARKDIKRITDSSSLNLSADFDVSVNLDLLKGSDAKATNEKRGLLSFIQGDGIIHVNGSVGIDNSTIIDSKTRMYSPSLTIENRDAKQQQQDIIIPKFRYPVKSDNNQINLVLSGNQMNVKSIELTAPNLPLVLPTWKLSDLSIMGLKIEKRNHPEPLKGQRK